MFQFDVCEYVNVWYPPEIEHVCIWCVCVRVCVRVP